MSSTSWANRPPWPWPAAPSGPAASAVATLAGCGLGLLPPEGLAPGVALALAGLVVLFLGLLVAVPARAGRTWARLQRGWPRILPLAVALLAFAATQAQVAGRLAERLDPALEGVDLTVQGIVHGLPAQTPGGLRFGFTVEAAWRAGSEAPVPGVPRRLSLAWFAPGGFQEAEPLSARPLPPVMAGDRWRLVVRLRQPHGARNPHGFDLERHLFAQGLRATGTVRSAPTGAPLAQAVAAPVERWRQQVRDALIDRTGGAPPGGVLAALLVGDAAAITRDDWTLFRDTGVAHLMAISGLHVTMFAWAFGGLAAALWRHAGRAALWLPAPVLGRCVGLAAALAYAVFAGWGVPAQRTVLMLALATLLSIGGRVWPWPAVLLVSAAGVVGVDPWALLDLGFWLSFAAVALLMGSTPVLEQPAVAEQVGGLRPAALRGSGVGSRAWQALPGLLRDTLRTQWVASVGLAPLSLILFHQVSVVGLLANLAAVPWVTLCVTPLALAGVWWPPAWDAGAWAVEAMTTLLRPMAAWPGAVLPGAAVPAGVQALGLLGGALAVLPLPAAWRALSVPLLLPLLWPVVAAPPPGRFDLLAVDVGQGTAVLVRTRHHLLVYDSGPRIGREGDAGERHLVPLLRARGERRIDQLMLSHRDTDHVGGAGSLLRAVAVRELRSSLEATHPLRHQAEAAGARVTACAAGQAWTWDGVRFEVLHPAPGTEDAPLEPGLRPNDRSCVLRVTEAPGATGGPPRSALLTGDIEAGAEAALLARAVPLQADWMLVPHHGSRTSSTAAFIEAVAPRWVVVQAAYRSRFGHPAPQVLARYRAAGAEVLATPQCGAVHWRHDQDRPSCERARQRRHWNHPESAPSAP